MPTNIILPQIMTSNHGLLEHSSRVLRPPIMPFVRSAKSTSFCSLTERRICTPEYHSIRVGSTTRGAATLPGARMWVRSRTRRGREEGGMWEMRPRAAEALRSVCDWPTVHWGKGN
ncbi:hypothetical protein JTB14_009687 [Gonioctena quinquepunctata]|nr:hypothetical protein JTB14_009687 [Gonioctena quinquepunctata]